MTPGVPTKIVGACTGLGGFAVALIAGMAAENPVETTLFRAIVGMVICQVAGLLIGAAAERTVREAIVSYKAAHPAESAKPGSGRSGAQPPPA